jgi:hypothetical protein
LITDTSSLGSLSPADGQPAQSLISIRIPETPDRYSLKRKLRLRLLTFYPKGCSVSVRESFCRVAGVERIPTGDSGSSPIATRPSIRREIVCRCDSEILRSPPGLVCHAAIAFDPTGIPPAAQGDCCAVFGELKISLRSRRNSQSESIQLSSYISPKSCRPVQVFVTAITSFFGEKADHPGSKAAAVFFGETWIQAQLPGGSAARRS